MGNLGQADFGVTHGCCVIAVYRTKVTLAVYQHVAHREVLRHTNNRVIDRLVSVGVVFTNHVTHNTGRLFVGPVPVVVELVHRKEHPAMHRFEAIPRVWQGPPHNHAHGVIQVTAAHLLFKADR